MCAESTAVVYVCLAAKKWPNIAPVGFTDRYLSLVGDTDRLLQLRDFADQDRANGEAHDEQTAEAVKQIDAAL